MTAAASRCAVQCRYSASASGLSGVTMRSAASCVERDAEIDETVVDDAASAALASLRRDRLAATSRDRACPRQSRGTESVGQRDGAPD